LIGCLQPATDSRATKDMTRCLRMLEFFCVEGRRSERSAGDRDFASAASARSLLKW
jgi:hypothetical protein